MTSAFSFTCLIKASHCKVWEPGANSRLTDATNQTRGEAVLVVANVQDERTGYSTVHRAVATMTKNGKKKKRNKKD